MMSEKSVLLSTAYLPPVSWFSLLLKHPTLIEQHETYQRQSYRNRCIIYSERGILPLSIPVNQPHGHHTRITEIKIYNGEKWYLNHWRAIQSAYESSPYFLYYEDDLKPFFSGEHKNLFVFNTQFIEKICSLIAIEPRYHFTEYFENNPSDKLDYREAISPKRSSLATFPEYMQVFADRHGFIADLSILDLLFNMGPESKQYLEQIQWPVNPGKQSGRD
jgi:hypothetical protein